jgi:hypothetical protein
LWVRSSPASERRLPEKGRIEAWLGETAAGINTGGGGGSTDGGQKRSIGRKKKTSET